MRITYMSREGQMLSTYISVSKLKLCVRLIFHMMSSLPPAHMLSAELQQTARGEMDASPRVKITRKGVSFYNKNDSFASFDLFSSGMCQQEGQCTVYAVDRSSVNL
jgi:hypothetical protein